MDIKIVLLFVSYAAFLQNSTAQRALPRGALKVGQDEHKSTPKPSRFGRPIPPKPSTGSRTSSTFGRKTPTSGTTGTRTSKFGRTPTSGTTSTGGRTSTFGRTPTSGTTSTGGRTSTFGRTPTSGTTSTGGRTSTFGRTPTSGSTSTGGRTSTFGRTPTSGTTSTGGRTSTFGRTPTSGTTSTGGRTSTFGRTPTSGTTSTGGRTSTFGRTPTSGTTSTGGRTSTFGRTPTSGRTSTGGRTSTPGRTSTSGTGSTGRFGTNSASNTATNQAVGGRATASSSVSNTATEPEEVVPVLPKCFHCSGVGQLDGKSLYIQGWKPKDSTPIENDCWTKPKFAKECEKGCVKTTAIGEPTDSTLLRELKKTGSGEKRIRMIVRTCAEDMEKMITKLTEGPTKVPYSNCTYSEGSMGILGANSGMSICSCEGELCNGEKGVVYALTAGSCRNGIRRYGAHDLTPSPYNRKKPSVNDQCDKFCAKNSICENTGFDPKQNRGAYCFHSKNPADCSVIVANGTDPLPATTVAPGAKPSWLFCEVCDS